MENKKINSLPIYSFTYTSLSKHKKVKNNNSAITGSYFMKSLERSCESVVYVTKLTLANHCST